MSDFEVVISDTYRDMKYVVVFVHDDHNNGYVAVDENHPLYGRYYDDARDAYGDYLKVHGGLTFSDKSYWSDEPEDLWWFGFDTSHSGDIGKKIRPWHTKHPPSGVYRTEEYVEEQCKLFIDQIAMPEYKENKLIHLLGGHNGTAI